MHHLRMNGGSFCIQHRFYHPYVLKPADQVSSKLHRPGIQARPRRQTFVADVHPGQNRSMWAGGCNEPLSVQELHCMVKSGLQQLQTLDYISDSCEPTRMPASLANLLHGLGRP